MTDEEFLEVCKDIHPTSNVVLRRAGREVVVTGYKWHPRYGLTVEIDEQDDNGTWFSNTCQPRELYF